MAPADPAERAAALLAGDGGEAAALAMRIVAGVARAAGATEYLPIESAHIDGCLYHGRAGLDLAERFVELGGAVTVRTTLNVGSLDLMHPNRVRADKDLRENGFALMQAYRNLGCESTFTCAPYQISHRPAFGSHVAWAESNAIAFTNSVLGARTDRYGDFIDIAAAITGLVPRAGLHLDAARRPLLVLACDSVPKRLWQSDAAWAALGAVLGDIAGVRVAALTGLPGDLADGGWTEDRLKSVAATAASAGGVALFHVVGVTPEAPQLATLHAPRGGGDVPERVSGTTEMLRAARDRLTTARGDRLDAVSVVTPHY
jgi:predicted aconitase